MSKSNDSYSRRLADPKWQQRRLKIFERDEFKCCACGNGSIELHCHHLYYERGKAIWDYPDGALCTLCAHCHTMAHCVAEDWWVPIALYLRVWCSIFERSRNAVHRRSFSVNKKIGDKTYFIEFTEAGAIPEPDASRGGDAQR